MKISKFTSFLERIVAPMFSGVTVAKAAGTPERASKALVVYLAGATTLRVKPTAGASMGFELRRSQAFDDSEKRLVEALVQEYGEIKRQADELVDELGDLIVRRAIARSVAPANRRQQVTIAALLERLTEWSAQTYEGERVSAGVLVASRSAARGARPSFVELMAQDFTKALTDGIESWWSVDAGGDLLKFVTSTGVRRMERGFFPERYRALASASSLGRIGLTVNRNGEILVFSHQELKFAKRGGMWLHFSHQSVIRQMSGGSGGSKSLREAVYESCLDVSFARTGACIGMLRKADLRHLVNESLVSPDDVLGRSRQPKAATAAVLIDGRKFQELSRLARKELLSLDGAVVLTADGHFHAAGAILELRNVKRGSHGGRSAAAKALSHFGLGIKVSEDGEISGYKKETGDEVPFFTVG